MAPSVGGRGRLKGVGEDFMSQESGERQLATILIADAVGFSSLMGIDEEGTYECLKADLRSIVRPNVSKHKGKFVKNTGDGFLAIFPNVLGALECAKEIQNQTASRSSGKQGKTALTYRIGINLGDIIDEGDDVYGDAINVAQRLEALADPGGIALSGAAYWSVKQYSKLAFQRIGFVNLKHIANPIEVFLAGGPLVETAGDLPLQTPDSYDQANHARSSAGAAASPKIWSESDHHHPTIVVLPFENLRGDPGQDYFCDGLTRDVTTELSRFSDIAVISANSAFSYRGKRPSPKRLHHELGADYVVEGGILRKEEDVRVNVGLIETSGSSHVWVRKLQTTLVDVFETQDEIVREIVASLSSRLRSIERDRSVRNDIGFTDAYDRFLRGLYFIHQFLGNDDSKDTLDSAQRYFAQAIETDEKLARAWGWQAYTLVQKWWYGWEDELILETAEDMARTAVKLDPSDYDTHWALASVLSNAGNFEQAMVEYQEALTINPNDADLHAEMSEFLTYIGKPQEAIGQVRFAMHLNPHFPDWYRSILGWAFYFAQEYDEAIIELRKMVRPADQEFLVLSICHARRAEAWRRDGEQVRGENDELAARKALDLFLQRNPSASIETQRHRVRFERETDLLRFVADLRFAGLPDA